MILIIIYLSGVLVSYVYLKVMRNKHNANEWKDVVQTFIVSVFSWIAIMLIVIVAIRVIIGKKLENKKPPWWL